MDEILETLSSTAIANLAAYLRQQVAEREEAGEDMTSTNWGTQTGVLITGSEAKFLVYVLEQKFQAKQKDTAR